jgi:hypothetical protein
MNCNTFSENAYIIGNVGKILILFWISRIRLLFANITRSDKLVKFQTDAIIKFPRQFEQSCLINFNCNRSVRRLYYQDCAILI